MVLVSPKRAVPADVEQFLNKLNGPLFASFGSAVRLLGPGAKVVLVL
jgi:hypothetical protein